jgi:nitrite reductase (NADH) small subunit
MPELLEIENVSNLPRGRAKTCVVNGRTIALYHTEDGFFATENTCPHRGGPLGAGDLIGNEIVCPWHLWGFDVITGLCTGNPEIAVPTIEVEVDGDRIFVRLP